MIKNKGESLLVKDKVFQIVFLLFLPWVFVPSSNFSEGLNGD